jgi:hypothetical protein
MRTGRMINGPMDMDIERMLVEEQERVVTEERAAAMRRSNAPGQGETLLRRNICPVDLPQMVADVERFIRKFVVLPEAAYLPLALWVIGTHAVDYFDCYSYLSLLSPTKRCGKTRLLEVLELLVADAWRTTAPTPAVLFRKIADGGTLLLDEAESLNNGKSKSESTQAILSILNSGHRKGDAVWRCEGPNHKLTEFPVYGPKAFAAIGRLPETLTDRSIVITLHRRTKGQEVARFLTRYATAEAKPIHEAVAGFASANQNVIKEAYERAIDLKFLSDRDADLWGSLFAICLVSVPDRQAELKGCAISLSARKAGDDEDDSLSLKLLTDIKAVWPDGEEHIDTATLLEKLRALEESPWKVEYELSPRKVARMLRPFGVESRGVRIGARTPRGYDYDSLKSAFERYLEV